MLIRLSWLIKLSGFVKMVSDFLVATICTRLYGRKLRKKTHIANILFYFVRRISLKLWFDVRFAALWKKLIPKRVCGILVYHSRCFKASSLVELLHDHHAHDLSHRTY
jgi:hypothetical protein